MRNMFKREKVALLIIFLGVIFSNSAGGQLTINEICASNTDVITDGTGEFGDWFEILNTGEDAINLGGYSVSDTETDPDPWHFPEYTLLPGEYLIVFASGKEISLLPTYWQTVIDHGEQWKYTIPHSGTSSGWREKGYDDSGWESGATGIGYGDSDDATIVSPTLSVFLRKSFLVENPVDLTGFMFHVDYDDGFVAYLNGTEVARVGVSGNPPAYNRTAYQGREAVMYRGGAPQSFDLQDRLDLLQQGENVLAVQVHNVSGGSSDLTIIPFLSLRSSDRYGTISPEIQDLNNTYFHTDFRLDAHGDHLYLWDPAGQLIDSSSFSYMESNHSVGRTTSDPDKWGIFDSPTPCGPNSSTHYQDYINELPLFSRSGGRFSATFQLSMTSSNPSDDIYFTLDGSMPDLQSQRFTAPIAVNDDAIIRARILRTGFVPGRTISHTYFRGVNHQLPVVCVSTDPENLWDFETGIYVHGPGAESEFPHFGANFWMDWEKPAHVEVYDQEGNLAFHLDAGIKIYGNWMRALEQKSLAIFARRMYGTGKIVYPLFDDREYSEFEAFVIRNSGNDWFGNDFESGTMYRDLLMTRLVRNMDVEHPAGRPAIVYLNGEYWGIQNMREKLNEHFVASNGQVDPEQVNLLENNQQPMHGDPSHYANLISYMNSHDISREAYYGYVKTQMDIQNFINYQVAQIFFDNRDWPGNNIKYWRPETPNGKWRWILYDTDFGFGLWNPDHVYRNTISFATEEDGPGHPNPPWSTFLLRKLLLNQEFKEQFINSFADQINTSFIADSVIVLIDQMRDAIDEEMYDHVDRWGGSYQQWLHQTNALADFARIRPSWMKNYIKSTFSLQSKQQLLLKVSDPAAGFIRLNSIHIRDFPWEGTYFQGNSVKITAIPMTGYRFTGWSGDLSGSEPQIQLDLSSYTTLEAHFEMDILGESPVVINEICYKQAPGSDSEDWVELHNWSDQYVDISEWVVKDDDDLHSYRIKQGSLLPPGGYQVVCRNLAAFVSVYPSVGKYEGEMGFGFSSNGESVRLYNSQLQLVDSVNYGVSEPWPVIPSGSGYTLALVDPESDNSLPESWQLSEHPLGTPGQNNSMALETDPPLAPDLGNLLFQNMPNPFSAGTRIVYYCSSPQPVRITIHDMKGQLVKLISDGILDSGYHEFEWIPAQGKEGVYLLRAESSGTVHTTKMIKLK